MTLSDPHLTQSLAYLRKRTSRQVRIALVLGSGLGEFADTLVNRLEIPSADIPHYPRSSVPGHKGSLVFGEIGDANIVACQGRVHLYETGSTDTVAYPVRLAHLLGATTLIVTNAAGGINRSLEPGDLMLITDHVSFTEPTIPSTPELRRGLQIPYSPDLLDKAIRAAETINVSVHRGVYAGVRGPSYETAAEVEMLHRIGADAVGMSTVPEVEVALGLGMQVLGISCITNKATGIGSKKLNHEEVTVVAAKVRANFNRFLIQIINSI